MTSGPLRGTAAPDGTTDRAGPPEQRNLPTRLGVTVPTPDEPLAVVATGPAGAARREVLAALLDVAPAVLTVPDDSWLVLRYAPAPTRVAWVPGYRQPHSYGADAVAAGPALSRPPRRVELNLPVPLLRHTALVGVPDTDALGVAGVRILLDAAGRGGALLFVISADQMFSSVELELLTTVARAGTTVFFVVTPGAAGGDDGAAPGPPSADAGPCAVDAAPFTDPSGRWPGDPFGVAVRTLRATLVAAVPELTEAPWFPSCPGAGRSSRGGDALSAPAGGPRPGDVDALRRTLVGWATGAGQGRIGSGSPAGPRAHRRVPVPAGVEGQGWADQLDQQTRTHTQRIRQHVALELANIHLRAVQEIVFGAGCAGLPRTLDREVHALSLLATRQCDLAVRWTLTDAFAAVFGVPPDEASYRRVCAAVRTGLPDHRPGRGLARVLLVTSTGGVADLSGAGALDALDCHPGAARDAVLPPVAVALSGACYLHWRGPGSTDQGEARSWVQRVLREIERELEAEVSRRFDAVRLALRVVLSDAVDHGILLA